MQKRHNHGHADKTVHNGRNSHEQIRNGTENFPHPLGSNLGHKYGAAQGNGQGKQYGQQSQHHGAEKERERSEPAFAGCPVQGEEK
ncbi:hypothetical protein D3C76_1747070 [compost metagenome]